MKTENWNGYPIRFVQKDGEWWGVLGDVCDALGLKANLTARRLNQDVLSKHTLNDANGRAQTYLIVNEKGIYKTIFSSRKPEAESFQNWCFDVIKELRQATGLEGFEVFRMLDKEHQKEAMRKIKEGLKPADAVSYMKANTIANKAVSTKHGYPKMLKKGQMTPEMLKDREAILDDTVELMTCQKKFDLNLSVSKEIYKRWDA